MEVLGGNGRVTRKWALKEEEGRSGGDCSKWRQGVDMAVHTGGGGGGVDYVESAHGGLRSAVLINL